MGVNPINFYVIVVAGYDIHFRKLSIIWKSDSSPKSFLVNSKKFLQKAGTSWLNQELQA